MVKQGGLKTILERMTFYREGQGIVAFVRMLLLLICVTLIGLIAYEVKNPPQPLYFAVAPDGKMIKIAPLNEPVLSDAEVSQWAVTAVRRAFMLDYVHWRDQLTDITGDFTADGYDFFVRALVKANALETIRGLKMVASASVNDVPEVLDSGVVNGRYSWKISMSVLISYQNLNRTIPMPLKVIVIVQRMPAATYPSLVAINNFMPATNVSVRG